MGAVATPEIAKRILEFTSIDEDLARVDATHDDVHEKRLGVINRLEKMVDHIDWEKVPEKMSEAMARMQPVTTLLGALKDHEAGIHKRAALKLKYKDTQSASNAAEAVAEFLRLPADQRMGKIIDKIDLDQIALDLNEEIQASDDPVQEFELREDPHDLS